MSNQQHRTSSQDSFTTITLLLLMLFVCSITSVEGIIVVVVAGELSCCTERVYKWKDNVHSLY